MVSDHEKPMGSDGEMPTNSDGEMHMHSDGKTPMGPDGENLMDTDGEKRMDTDGEKPTSEKLGSVKKISPDPSHLVGKQRAVFPNSLPVGLIRMGRPTSPSDSTLI